MSNPARFAVLGLSLVIASVAAVAEVEMDEDGFTSFESVDSGETHSLDQVDTGHTETLDSVDTGHTETLDSVDTGHTETLDSVDVGRTVTLDSVDDGQTLSLEKVEAERGPWRPLGCDSLAVALGKLPEGSDPDAWSDALRKAQQAIQTSKFELEQADRAYTQARNFKNSVGTPRADIIRARKDARAKYSQSRCTLPELVELARRAGVTPGLLRPYQESPASSD